jgi:hypothetical protein
LVVAGFCASVDSFASTSMSSLTIMNIIPIWEPDLHGHLSANYVRYRRKEIA